MDLPASREAIPQWLECSDEHSQPMPELVLRAQEAIPSAFMVDNKRDTAGNVSSCSDSPDAPQCIPYPFVLPMLPDPEPKASPWAQPSDSICPPDTSLEKDSKCPAVGYPNSTQAGLKTAAKQSPEPQLIDSLAALIRARLAGRSASEEFRLQVPKVPSDELVLGEGELCPQVPKGPPDRTSKAEERHCYNVVNKTTGTSTSYSPLAEAALSLPETPPAFLSQVLLPRPGFNGHKPILLIEGERRLKTSVVNKINGKSIVEHLLIVPETVAGQSQAVKLRERLERAVPVFHDLSLLWPSMDLELHCMGQENLVGELRTGIQTLVHNTRIVSMQNNEAEGPHIPRPKAFLSPPTFSPATLTVPTGHPLSKIELIPRTQPRLILLVVVR
jgi:hypothetical protein